MVLFALSIKVEMTNCSSLKINGITEWPLDLKQPNSDEVKKGIIVSSFNEQKLDNVGGDNVVNFAMKWPGSKKQSSLSLITGFCSEITSEQSESDEWITIIGFECRGLEPYNWNVPTKNEQGLGFEVVSESGEAFKICEWDQQSAKLFEWSDYDEDNECLMTMQIVDWKLDIMQDNKKGKKGKAQKKKKKSKK